jgi:hypothetical protein
MRERLDHVPPALAVSAVVLVVAVAVAWLTQGGAQALGAAAGVAVAVLSYLVSSLVVAWVDSVNPRLLLPVGLASYVIKFVLLGLAMLAVSGTGWAGTTTMCIAIIPGILGWVGANLWWALRRPAIVTRRTPMGSGQATGYQE